ncbi:MAG: hypothetical protein JOY62_18960 [Acidobacteriaceae bacterium]|nr:hypothetical protein [Acidobacteriaceae bacterium]MBV9782049.1 hypothetical protein [Acidobacteriaceae bacterium]
MDLLKIIAELQAERQRIDEAIQALERLAAINHRRGRPPRWKKIANEAGALEAEALGEEKQAGAKNR